jgi:hypothetical protein
VFPRHSKLGDTCERGGVRGSCKVLEVEWLQLRVRGDAGVHASIRAENNELVMIITVTPPGNIVPRVFASSVVGGSGESCE